MKHFHIVNQKAIRENIRKLSVADGAFWKIYAENQLREYDGDKTSPTAWMEQFNKLGIGYIGKRLLMQIKVIRFDGPTRPFAAKEHEMLGQKVCYCYISDEDPGGSWVSIKDLLTHAHKPGNVAGVVWNSKSGKIQFPECTVDELVVCEDGLWSGSETKRRLEALRASGVNVRVRLKFAVASDFGLRVARHAIRSLQLTHQVQVDAHDAEIVKFLNTKLPKEFLTGEAMEFEDYFKGLHDYVEPAAFCNEMDWPEGREIALDTCKNIGGQLVREWYESERPGADVGIAVEKFALGGGGFASTVFLKEVFRWSAFRCFGSTVRLSTTGRKYGGVRC